MRLLATAAVLVVVFLHCSFAYLEMVAWTQPLGLEIFNMSAQEAANSAVLAFNQGFYNLMLAVGLVFGLPSQQRNVVRVLLMIIVAVGIVGGLTVSARIFALQAAPALLAWVLVRASVISGK